MMMMMMQHVVIFFFFADFIMYIKLIERYPKGFGKWLLWLCYISVPKLEMYLLIFLLNFFFFLISSIVILGRTCLSLSI